MKTINFKKYKLSLVIFCAILLTSLWSASGTLDSSDAIVRERVAHQLVIERRLVVNSFGDEKNYSTFRDHDGSYLSSWGFGQSILFLPFEALSNLVTQNLSSTPEQNDRIRFFLISIPVLWLGLAINFWLCLKLAVMLKMRRLTAYVISFIAIFGSSFWQMTKQGQEEIQLSILLLCAIYGFLCWKRNGNKKYIWLSAISAPAVLIFRLTALPITIGIIGLYLCEIFFRKEEIKLKLNDYLQVLISFSFTIFCFIGIVGVFNLFKTGNPLKSGVPFFDFSGSLINGIVEPIMGLDKGILWTNIWLLPFLFCSIISWKYLKYNLKQLLFLSLFLFISSIAIYCKWMTWAGDHTYGARYQVHLVPLLCLTLGVGTITYIKTYFYQSFYQIRSKLFLVFFGLILFLLQIPSITFVHNLEIYQALRNNAVSKSRNGSPTGALRQIQLRYANFLSKMITGTPVKISEVNPSAVSDRDWKSSQRWNFWPWLAENRVSPNITVLLKTLWILIVLASIICWFYASRLLIYSK